MKTLHTLILLSFLMVANSAFGQDEGAFDSGSSSSRMSYSEANDRKWSPWSYSFFQIASIQANQTYGESGGQISTYNYFGFNYSLGFGKKIAIRPTFYFNTAGYNKYGDLEESNVKIGDIYVSLEDRYAALLPGNIGLATKYRLYLPTGEYTRNTKQIAKLHGWFIFDKPLTRTTTLEYHNRPYYYFQSQTGYVLHTPTKDLTQQNKQWELNHYLSLRQRINQELAVAFSVGRTFEHFYGITDEDPVAQKYNNLTQDKTTLTDAYAIDIYFSAMPGLNFMFKTEQEHYTFGSKNTFHYFDEAETTYSLWTFLSI